MVEDERLRYAGNDARAGGGRRVGAALRVRGPRPRGSEREVACPHGWSHPLLHSARFLPPQLAPTAAAGALVPHRWLVAAAAGVLRASSAEVQRLRFAATPSPEPIGAMLAYVAQRGLLRGGRFTAAGAFAARCARRTASAPTAARRSAASSSAPTTSRRPSGAGATTITRRRLRRAASGGAVGARYALATPATRRGRSRRTPRSTSSSVRAPTWRAAPPAAASRAPPF